jgi:hypothetical protein
MAFQYIIRRVIKIKKYLITNINSNGIIKLLDI